MPEPSGKMLKITLVKSPIGYNRRQKETVKSLGLRRMSQTVVLGDGAADSWHDPPKSATWSRLKR